MKFERGDKVMWTDDNGNDFYGEVTIAREYDSKVIFDGDPNNSEAYIPEYDYYPNEELARRES